MSGYRVGDAHPAKNTTPHGSHADPLRTCDECGASFKPRILIGANASRFCGTPCKDRWHARARKKQSPPSVAADAAGEETQNHNVSAPDHTPRAIQTPIRQGTKLAAVLAHLADGKTLNRFEAERTVHDHVLPTTISEIEKRGIRVDRKEETVRGFRGHPTRVARYWLADDQQAAAKRLLGHE